MPSPKKLTIGDKVKASLWLASELLKSKINVKTVKKDISKQIKDEVDRFTENR